MDEKKYKSVTVIWGVIFLILQALILIDAVGLRPDYYTYLQKLLKSFIAVVMIGLVIIFIVLSLKKKKSGPIIGMVVGAVYILNFNIVSTIVGIWFVFSCASMLKDLKLVETVVEKEKPKEVKHEEKQEESA